MLCIYESTQHTAVSRSRIISYSLHFAGIVGCSIIACLVAFASTGIALSPVFNRPDDAPRTEEAFTGLELFCGFISEVMLSPFFWIPPHALNDTESIFLLALFWGLFLYLFLRVASGLIRRVLLR